MMMQNEQNPLIDGKDSDEASTELELSYVPLTDTEIRSAPEFKGALNTFCLSISYAFNSLWFALKYCIYCNMIVEVLVFMAFGFVIVGGGFGLSAVIVFGAFGSVEMDALIEWILFIVFGIVTSVFIFCIIGCCMQCFLGCAFRRLSAITEQIMKGNKRYINPCWCAKGGGKFSWVTCLKDLIIMGVSEGAKYLVHTVIAACLLPLLSFVNLIPVIGWILFGVLSIYIPCIYFGYNNMLAIWGRKKVNYFLTWKYTFQNHWAMCGHGFGSLLMYCIPLVNILYYFFADVGGTRLYMHLEIASKVKAQSVSGYENVQQHSYQHIVQQHQKGNVIFQKEHISKESVGDIVINKKLYPKVRENE